MRSIKRLPRAVHSSLRSCIFLFDLTRVVEELVFNSVDAGASKVHVSVGVGACYVKVEDDGCGVSRDGLVLLGEKYATSKLHCLSEMDAGIESFGFRGEALGSLSDVSLLEVVTKARGRPNGYRKVIKGSKCLFLGIDDHRQDAGTTVIVRDLFYNQPVRRKCMQSSPKKVLHSVKKCVLRTALVYPQISFKIVDIESEDELLCTLPSPSPLPLVTSCFGNEVSSSLHGVNFSVGALKLSGYLSGPAHTFSTKDFQYVYINSRFVCKGPIHKLLNNLTANFLFSLSPGNSEPEFQNGKRQRTQSYPAYMLNLYCPQSGYDITFEPLKTVAEFKDWSPVLSFVEQAVRHFWSRISTPFLQGELHGNEDVIPGKGGLRKEDDIPLQDISAGDLPGGSEVAMKKGKIQCYKKSLSLGPSTSSLEMPLADIGLISHQKKLKGSSSEPHPNTAGHKGCKSKTGHARQNDFSPCIMTPDTWDISDVEHCRIVRPKSDIHLRSPDIDLFPVEDHLLSKKLTVRWAAEDDMEDVILGPGLGDWSFDIDSNLSEGSIGSIATYDHFGLKNDKPSFSECPLMGNNLSFIDFVDPDYGKGSSQPIIRKCQTSTELDVFSSDFIDPHPCKETHFTKECGLQNESLVKVGERGSDCHSASSEWCFESPFSLPGPAILKEEFGNNYATEKNFRSCRSDSSRYPTDGELNDEFLRCYTDENKFSKNGYPTSICTNTEIEYKNCFSPERDVHTTFHSDEIIFGKGDYFNKLDHGTDWMFLSCSNKGNTDNYAIPACHIPSPNFNKTNKNRSDELEFQICGRYENPKIRSKRSCSAPPFYKRKSKFSGSDHSLTSTAEKPNDQFCHNVRTLPATNYRFKDSSQSCGVSQLYREPILAKDSLPCLRMEKEAFKKHNMNEMQKSDRVSCDLEDPGNNLTKWRNGDPQATVGYINNDEYKSNILPDHEDDILDISSGLLHLAGGSLVPESINKDCLESAKVLPQLDKKFIPILAGTNLAIVDQHAADERIRLEELRRKVLPEIEFQLLQNYAEQIKNWGWICNVHAQGSESFTKNLKLLHRRPFTVALVAVPCILGINLSDKDLVEFLEQLSETDGSSSMPPAVLRILNFKACRGAIMFGDSLLPSECSLIVEELRQTSLCFQCAHGRPTTVPLVNLEALHNQLAKLGLQNGGSTEAWHGLRQHRPTLERAKQRLISASD
ncbi:MUTL protein homolog 3 isoform X2 [Tasmannia lanceolata]|uniref:MUTL protein homolog 3 isoform X2 n=1 Tax=Tasmannia lanceolata TaxID=3420 RepID=UPI004063A993